MPAGGSAEQNSGEEAEVNEIPDDQSPYGGIENNPLDKSAAQGTDGFRATPIKNSKIDKSAEQQADDQAMDGQDNERYENEQMESSDNGQSEMMVVEVQSGHLQPYLQAEQEEYNDELNKSVGNQNSQEEFSPS